MHWITQLVLLVFMHWIVIYPVDSVIHLFEQPKPEVFFVRKQEANFSKALPGGFWGTWLLVI